MNRNTKDIDNPPSVSYLQLFRFASPRDKLYILVGIITSIICGLLYPISVELSAQFMDSLNKYKVSLIERTPQKDTFYNTVKTVSLNYVYMAVVTFTLTYIGVLALKISSLHQVHQIRIEYLKAVLNQDFSYFDLHETGDFPNKMISNMTKFEEGINEKLGFFFYYVTLSLVSLIMAFVRGWKLTLICMSILPIIFVTTSCLSLIVNKMTIKEEALASQLANILEEVLSGIRTVHAFSGQKKEYERYQLISRNLKKYCLKKHVLIGICTGIILSNMYMIYCLVFWYGYLFILDGSYDFGKVMAVLMYLGATFTNLGTINQLVVVINGARGSTASIYQLLDNVPTINPLKNDGEPLKEVKGDIELKNVHFHYPSRPDVPILRGVNLTVNAGQVVAFIGHSGCGKSTILQLVSRYYDTNHGSVTLDGRDVKSLPVRWLRDQIGFVRQEPVLFDTTVMENIRYGREDATRDDIIAAAQLANAHEFITKLTDGYNTVVGAGGASISGGQKQRISIARALVRNPKILMLDEATSALDNVSEALVQDALDQAQKGRTTIIIAHRLTTVQNADLIYVFEKGNIIEFGSPAQLTDKKGIYYKMMITQGIDPNNKNLSNNRLSRMLSTKDIEKINEVTVVAKEKLEYEFSDTKHITFCQILGLTRPEWFYALLATLTTIVSSMSLLFISFLVTKFITATAKKEKGRSEVREICIYMGIMSIANCVLTILETILYGICAERLLERLKLRMFSKYLSYEMEFYDNEKHSVGALSAKFSTNICGVNDAVADRKIGTMLLGAFTFLVTLVVALVLHHQLGLVIAAFAPILLLVAYHEGKLNDATDTQSALGLEKSSKLAVEVVSNYQTVTSLVNESMFVREYGNLLKITLRQSIKAAFGISLVYTVSRSINYFMNASVFYYAAFIIAYQDGSVDTTFQASYMILMGASTLSIIFIYLPNIQKGIKACRNIIADTNRKVKITDPDPVPLTAFACDGSASFENVKFKYPSRPHVTVFDGINLQVERGKTTAMVGASGCGKSTAIQLLMRYYDPDEGIIRQSGIPLPQLRLNDFRRTIGLVQQEPILFDRTINDNIGYGLESSTDTARIHDAAQQAYIHNFIISLPQGYETIVGKKGTQLSGGQKQRIALARALVRQPKLLLLDEATSNLDAESEKVVQEALDKAKEGRTCVIIAHRLNTIRSADVICVLNHGKLAENGTHDQLMALKGHYYNLHNVN